ncbi:hypothetical protein [Photobacterium nomapromontoriensis]|uniref:hypothetical protein n=1 Tax=Photobacterium nomapromontoriensis TaxID=2910237 RepID=UPI003D135C9C
MNDIRRNGAVVDKGIFYPKNTYSFTYRYCANSEQDAARDIADYQILAQRVCDANAGQLTLQDSGTWCVTGANTLEETPIFSARISSTELWADLCLDGPFVTLRVIENTTAPTGEWFEAAEILGYDPYSPQRQVVLASVINSPLYQPSSNINTNSKWSEESQYIYSNIGTTVCLYDQTDKTTIGYTYRGQVYSVNNGMVKVLAREKIKGDIRVAPAWEPVKWHKEAYITAAANSWFVCSS